jgi:hypothetical protein
MATTPDRLAGPPPANTPTVDVLVQQIGPLAQKLGVVSLIIIGRDPRTNEAKLYGSPAAIADLRSLIADKCQLFDGGETGWDG